MKNTLLIVGLALSGCVDIPEAHRQFCIARPELCGDGGIDAGTDGGTDAGGCPSSDEFDQPQLSTCWRNLDPSASVATSSLDGGKLVVLQRQGLTWSMNGTRGFLLYQPLTGNFVAQTSATLGRLDGGPGFGGNYTAAALIAFEGTRTASRLVSVGTLGAGDVAGVLAQYTSDAGQGTRQERQTSSFGAELRMCRIGAELRTYYREHDGGALWNPLLESFFPDAGLPDTLLVGPGAYNVGGTESSRVEFETFRVRTDVTSLSQCEEEL